MRTLPSLKQLQYLVALATHLNFTRAAEASFVTQSTLSAGLRELESALGVRLVERNRQTVLMTPLGEEIARRARQLLAEAQDLVRIATEAADPMQGQIRLGIIPTIAPFILPALLAQLRAHHPKLQLALREDRSAELLHRIDDGRLDIALIALPYETGSLRVEALFDDPLWLVTRTDTTPNSESETAPRRLLLLEEGHCLREHSLSVCSPRDQARTDLEATSLLTLVQMVESGLGAGLLPEMAIRNGLAESANLSARPFSGGQPGRTIALVTRSSTPHPQVFAALAECLRALHATTTSSAKTPPD